MNIAPSIRSALAVVSLLALAACGGAASTSGGQPAPTLVSITPGTGPTSGGTSVTLTGANLTDVRLASPTVTFGGAAATITATSATSVTVTTPAHAAGAVDVVLRNGDGQSATLPGVFTYVAPPELVALSPDHGPVTGGTAVTLTGTGFAAPSVTFDGVAVAVTASSGTAITVTSPAHAAGGVQVLVTNAGGAASNAQTFTYQPLPPPPPTIATITPGSGPAAGGAAVTISGADFSAAPVVTFGGAPAFVSASSATSISVVTPAHAAGIVAVAVTNFDGQSAVVIDGFVYVAPAPTVASLSVTLGPTAGGTAVTISGADFSTSPAVTFGGAAATVTASTATTVTVTTPAHAAGLVGVVVTNGDGQSATLGAAFLYRAPAPVLTSLTPSSGTTLGGTALALTGTGFASPSVTIDGTGVIPSASSATSISITTLAHAAGPVSVVVTNGDGQASGALTFTYVTPPPIITSITPASGTALGGTPVTIAGSGFATPTVRVDGTVAPITSSSGLAILMNMPAHAAGAASVTVTNGDGQVSNVATFTYVAPAPTVASITPTTGTTLGGNSVVISGSNFATPAVSFGGSAGTVIASTASSITVTSPAHAAGAVTVTVTNADAQVSNGLSFTYVAPAPSIATVTPSTGTTLGGTSVVIAGSSFSSPSVSFGGTAGTVTASTASSITVTSPAHAAGAVTVTVTNGDAQVSNGLSFTFVAPAPSIATVTPSTGTTLGGTSVVISGSNFATPAVSFGGSAGTVTASTASSITVTSPAHAAGAVTVTVTNADAQVSNGLTFTYVAPAPIITSITPASGTTAGGNSVVIAGTGFSSPTVSVAGANALVTASTATSITFVAPAHAAGAVSVVVTNGDLQASNAATYTYVAPTPPPSVTSLTPNTGTTLGGTSVVISGSNFATPSVSFGGTPGTVTASTASSITVTSPAHAAGAVTVTVTNADAQVSNGVTFTYVAPAPTVASITPSTGTTLGGTSVVIAGSNFATPSVSFGGTAGTVTASTASSITVTSPAHAAGLVTVTVTNADAQVSNGVTFTYVAPAPTVASITPSTGTTLGGTSVVIAGSNFSGATVTFGVAAGTVTAQTSTSITVTTPAHASGLADVKVTNADGQSVTRLAAFTFVAPAPAIASVTPISGTTLGGTSVVIAGSSFASATVTFGLATATITVQTATSITVTTPPHAAGPVDVVVTNGDLQAATAAAAFTYVAPAPSIASLTPATGVTTGGTSVVLAGANFATPSVSFGGTAGTVTASTASSITVTSPAHAAGPVTVTVTNGDAQVSNGLTFAYALPAPTIASVTPATGTTAGGTSVVIAGTNFSGASVTFGVAAGTVTAQTATSVTVTTPAHAAGLADVTVVNGDGQSAVKAAGFLFVTPAPSIASVTPVTGLTTGGQSVVISGASFSASPFPTVTFGLLSATVTAATATSLTVTTPVHAAGLVDVVVTNPDAQAATAAGAFTYVLPAPTIATVSPATGLTTGGAVVTIAGTNFVSPAVTFGGTAGTVTASSATSITVTAPAHAAGAVSVVVTNSDGQAATRATAFTYLLPAPAVSAVTPATGVPAGGTSVVVSGSNFTGASVTFGGLAATVTGQTATAITVTTPAHALGAVNVVVTNSDGQTATATGAFTYRDPPPVAASLTPSTGSTVGGISVVISGAGFSAPAVTFGGATATVTASTATSITATAPAHAAGPVAVVVTNGDGQASASLAFTYVVPPPAIVSISPATGAPAGGSLVTISGTGFSTSPAPTVSFGGATTSPASATSTTLSITLPPHAAGVVDVTVTNADGQSATAIGGFTYVAPPAPVLASLSATSGALAGGTPVTLTGTNFSPPLIVLVGGVQVAASAQTATSASITTPAAATAGPVSVTVTSSDGQVSNALTFTYLAAPPPPTVTSVTPATGTTLGGQTVSVAGSGFSAAPKPTVTFGSVAGTVSAATATLLTVVPPPHAAGAVAVTVTNPDAQSGTLPAGYTYVAPPSVTQLTPATGTTGGGTSVTFTGSGFSVSPPPTVAFGGTGATVSPGGTSTSFTVITPSHGAGAVDVLVTNPDGQSTTLLGAFTFQQPVGTAPTITSVLSDLNGLATGAAQGGEPVTITGTGFFPGALVFFGAAPATSVVWLSTNTITCVTPLNQIPGTVDVTVSLPGTGLAGTLPGGFTFLLAAPSVVALSEYGSPAAGGGLLVVSGSNLSSVSLVTFNGVAGTEVAFVPGTLGSLDSLTVIIPPSPLLPAVQDGFVTVTVTNPDGQSSTIAPRFSSDGTQWPANFHYGPAPAVTGFNPAGGKGLDVTITGTNFSADLTGPRAGLQVLMSGPNVLFLQVRVCPSATDKACPVGVTSPTPTSFLAIIPGNRVNPGNYVFTVTNFDTQTTTAAGNFVVP